MSRQGRKKGRGSFSTDELDSLLDTLEAILPIEYEEWQQVVDAHDAHFPSTGRDVNSIKRKFCTLHRKKPPPGDPYCPPQVRQAKRIEYKIVNRAECGYSEEDDDIVALEDVVEPTEPTEVSATATISTTTRVVPTPSKKRSYNNRSGPDGQVVDVLTALLSQIQHKRDEDRKSQENQRDADRRERREDKEDEQDARRQDKKDMMLRMTQGKKRKKTFDIDRSDSDSD